MTTPSRSLSLVALALALGVAIVVVQIRVIAGGQTWDDVRFHTEVAPPRLAAAAAVQRGEVPAWWDGSGLGRPAGRRAEPRRAVSATLARGDAARARSRDHRAPRVGRARGRGVGASPRQRSQRAPRGASGGDLRDPDQRGAALRGTLPALAPLPWLGAAVGWLSRATMPRERLAPAIDRALLDGALGVACLAIAVGFAWRAPGRRIAVLFALVMAPSVGAARSIAPTIDRATVAIPAGAHRVHWAYSTPGLFPGALVALAGALGLVALWGLGRDRRTSPGELAN